jgi:gamma-glutamylcyclotransferase (GGCT)/AIG2-like uncharacterized protein YtfP
MGERVFTYGTLMFHDVMEAVTGQRFHHEEATLKGFARYELRGVIYPGLVKEEEGATLGVLYLDVDEKSLKWLDDFEDDFYKRESVCVETRAARVTALAYVLRDDVATQIVEDQAWSPQDFWREHQKEYIDSCLDFQREMLRKEKQSLRSDKASLR